MQNTEIKEKLKNWAVTVQKYQTPSTKKAVIQIINTFVPFLALWVLMYFSLDWHYGITIGLAIINAFFMVRIFIIQHDCGHQSFFKSRRLNNIVGFGCSFFSSIPYKYWAKSHAFHHAHCGQLEEGVRDIGDIHIKTVAEFRSLSKRQQWMYRIYRSAPVMFVLGPLYYSLVPLRFPVITLKGWKKTRYSQVINNICVIGVYVLLAYLLGWDKFVLIHIPLLIGFFVIAVWFFYVQHQHEEAYKAWKENWEYLLAAVQGSTYYKLPKVFQWLTGNIGFHHIHHLSSKIPNYNLEMCNKENPIFEKYATTLTFFQSLKTVFNTLWDEEQQRMISFREFYRMEKMMA
jgi:omega-6 fatty acid desaturase (delta-12 desaturase)